jgi:beta-lactamase regulating signal transducer with metallopeptidase domain
MIEWMVSSSILIAVMIALRHFLRGKISLRIQYALWALVLVRLLVPLSLGNTGFSVLNILPENPAGAVLSATQSGGVPGDAYTLPAGTAAAPEHYAAAGAQEETPHDNQDAVTNVEAHITDWGAIVFAVWIAGLALVGSFLLVSNLRFAARMKKTRSVINAGEYRLSVYVTSAVDTPCLFGLFRPAIYVTPETAADATMLRHAAEHETTHFRHGDHVWSVLRGVCLALHWYNPLVWYAAFLSRRDAELACDEATISRIGEGERAEYGRTLIGMTCRKRSSLLLTATTMTGSARGIKERIMLIAKKPQMAVSSLVAVVLIAAVAVGCTFTGAARETDRAGSDVALYDCGGLTVAIPNEHLDRLIVRTGDELNDDTVLISVEEKASVEAAAADGLDDSGLGWLFSIVRYDLVRYERYLCADGSGLSFFAKDNEWYYGYHTASDVRFYRSGDGYSDQAARAQWDLLNNQMGPSVRDDFVVRNHLTPYSDTEARSGYTYGGTHRFLNYYPYYSVNGSRDEVYVLVLSQPAKQGDGGIWCVERMLDSTGYAYLWFPDSGRPASEYYAELQTQCDAGYNADLLDVESAAIAFLKESGYFGSPVVPGSLLPASDPAAGATLDVLAAMRDVKASDFTNPDDYGNVTAGELAQALNAAAANQIDAAQAVSAGYLEGVYPIGASKRLILRADRTAGWAQICIFGSTADWPRISSRYPCAKTTGAIPPILRMKPSTGLCGTTVITTRLSTRRRTKGFGISLSHR